MKPVGFENHLIIRSERPDAAERRAVHSVHRIVFGRTDEADLVDRLRSEGAVLASLVAEVQSRIVGHLLFTRMWIETTQRSVASVALAPIAVLPEHQREGIGGRLIQHGLEALREEGERIVLVLGHPEYYRRFGFSCEKASPLSSAFPPDAYLALELCDGALDGIRGKVRYPVAFGV